MKISFETISRLTDRDPRSSLHGQSDWATAPPERGPAPKRRGATAMTFSLRSLALAMLAIAALAGGAVALTRSKPIDSAVLGPEWQCHKTAFVITTCTLRTQSQAAPALDNLLVTSITGRHGGWP